MIIRDGWGVNPDPEWNRANAVHLARTPVDSRLTAEYPHVLIRTSGNDVGLPDGVMGNSEVGHQNIGAGRIVEQEIMRITSRIDDGSFFSNPALVRAFERAAQTGGDVHMIGLCSDGRVHSDLDHLYGLLAMTRRQVFPGDRVFVHAFTDGRDTLPNSGIAFLEAIETRCREVSVNPVASVVGRYYAMDRDHRWDRVEKAYRMLVHGEGDRFSSAAQALRHYYAHPSEASRTGDEFVLPSVITRDKGSPTRIRDGDSVIFFNFRGDRPRELCAAFVHDEFPLDGVERDGTPQRMGFDRGSKLDLCFVTMTSYKQGLPVHVAFGKPPELQNILGAYVAKQGLTQFRCSETEKYPHVTFFFNDYRDEPFPGEDRHLVPSPRDVTTYDQKPEMSAYAVTDAVVERIAGGRDDLVVINYANGDMVGHTGDLQAAIRAVEVVDECVGRVVDAVLEKGGGLIVTADHGNCEQMIDPASGGPHTAHTTYDVELIVVDERYRHRSLRTGGRLADIAPTLLELLGLPKPEAMTGSSLLKHS
ncbi:MAG: 2,3-bisphosphoglycerate-independent phosphoglycerate mutase [Acidobacteria bacterium]|nr:2,3-bisphosphoglycerate-independent phosphoglycerate mutase [Acidobacteriota bacterium]